MDPIRIDLTQMPAFRMLMAGTPAQDTEAFVKDAFASLYKGAGGIEKNSFTTAPAIGLKAVLQSTGIKPLRLTQNANDERRLITGVMMVPGQLLLKSDGEGQFHLDMYSKEVIYHARNKFMMGRNSTAIDWEHSGPLLSDSFLVETWIVENGENDKLNALGFTEQFRSMGFDGIPTGCLACTYFVPNDTLWNELKSNPEGYGFSIMGYFASEPITQDQTERLLSKAVELSHRDDMSSEQKCAVLRALIDA